MPSKETIRQLPRPNALREIKADGRKSPTLAHKIANAPTLIANIGGCHDQNRDRQFNNCSRKTQGEPTGTRAFQSKLARLSGVARFKICTFELGGGALSPEDQQRIRTALETEAARLRSAAVNFGQPESTEGA